MSKASAKNNPKQLDAKREKRARQAQRRAEREHPNAAAIAPVARSWMRFWSVRVGMFWGMAIWRNPLS